jgi:hypothetical protein
MRISCEKRGMNFEHISTRFFGYKILFGRELVIKFENKHYYYELVKDEVDGTYNLYSLKTIYQESWCKGLVPKEKYIKIIRINPFPRILRRLKYWHLRAKLHITHQEWKLCQGCGEGINKYLVEDPNEGKDGTFIRCCEKCYQFYGMKRIYELDENNKVGKLIQR